MDPQLFRCRVLNTERERERFIDNDIVVHCLGDCAVNSSLLTILQHKINTRLIGFVQNSLHLWDGGIQQSVMSCKVDFVFVAVS